MISWEARSEEEAHYSNKKEPNVNIKKEKAL